MKHKINLSFSRRHPANLGMGLHLRKCIQTALTQQGVPVSCEINVLITDDDGIRVINQSTRNIDKPTDVLSFPMFQLQPGALPQDWSDMTDPETERVPLGDMVISLERAIAQGEEYGHGIKRELGYLSVHSVLHLLGYDHMDDGPMKAQMRQEEEAVMEQLLLRR